MGYDQLASNYLTIPVYCFGALGFFTFAFFSDRYHRAGPVRLFDLRLPENKMLTHYTVYSHQ